MVLAINQDTGTDDAWRFLVSFPINYTAVSDTEGRVARLYQLPGMPPSFLRE